MWQVTLRDTGHVIECADIKTAIDDPARRTHFQAALDLVLRQGTLLKPE